MVELWQAEADARGGYELTVSEYAPGTTDYSSLILPAKDAGAEALLALPNSPDGLAMMKQIKELDWNAKVYFLIRAPDPPTFGENLGVDSDGVFLLPGWNPGLPYPGVKEMAERHMAEFGSPAVALTGPAYACVEILADSITRAASVDRDAIRDAIAATNLDTMVGPACSSRKTVPPTSSTRSTSGRVASRPWSSPQTSRWSHPSIRRSPGRR